MPRFPTISLRLVLALLLIWGPAFFARAHLAAHEPQHAAHCTHTHSHDEPSDHDADTCPVCIHLHIAQSQPPLPTTTPCNHPAPRLHFLALARTPAPITLHPHSTAAPRGPPAINAPR